MKHLGVTSPGSWALSCACTVPSCPWLGWRRGCLKSRAFSCEVPGYLCFLLLLSPFPPSPASKPALFIDAQLLRGTERARNVRSGKLWKLCFFSFFFPPLLAAFPSIFPRGHIKGYYVSDQTSTGRIFPNSHSLHGRIVLLGLKLQPKCCNVQGAGGIDQDVGKHMSLPCTKLIFLRFCDLAEFFLSSY